jgi:hypothetical protein
MTGCALDETRERRRAGSWLLDRRDDAGVLMTGRWPSETSFAAPTSISSWLVTASLCAMRGRWFRICRDSTFDASLARSVAIGQLICNPRPGSRGFWDVQLSELAWPSLIRMLEEAVPASDVER